MHGFWFDIGMYWEDSTLVDISYLIRHDNTTRFGRIDGTDDSWMINAQGRHGFPTNKLKGQRK